MKKRSSEILKYIIVNDNETISFKELSKKYKISEKTLNRDFEEIDDFLKEISVHRLIFNEENEILNFNNDEKEIINVQLLKLFNTFYVMSSSERIDYIITILLNNKKYVTMNDIADYLYVSRVTIMNDMADVETVLTKYNGVIDTRPGRGIKLVIEEYNARILISDILMNAFFKSNKEFEITSIFYYKIVSELYKTVDINEINRLLKQAENKSELKFSSKGFRITMFYLYALTNRREFDLTNINKEKKINDILEYICTNLELSISNEESIWFDEFIHNKKVFIPSTNVDDYQEIYAVVVNFLYKISEELNVNLYDDYALFKFISLHLYAMSQRLKKGFSQKNELKEIIKKEYPTTYKAVLNNINVIEEYFKVKVDDDELSFIVMHLCADLIRRKADNKCLSTMIVCPEGVAAAELLRAQIKQCFNVSVKKTITENHLAEEDNFDVDFIISTVAFSSKKAPVIVVDSILSAEKCDDIQTLMFRLLKENGNVAGEKQLGIGENVQYLYQVIKPNTILISKEELSWKKALQVCANCLIDNYETWDGFGGTIIKLVEENGPYIAVQKGIAIAHALCPDKTYNNACSLLVSKNGIHFGNKATDPIYLVFCLSINKSEAYIEIVKDILDIGRSRSYIDQIINLENSREIYKLIKDHRQK